MQKNKGGETKVEKKKGEVEESKIKIEIHLYVTQVQANIQAYTLTTLRFPTLDLVSTFVIIMIKKKIDP